MAATFDWQTFDSSRVKFGATAIQNGNSGKKVVVTYIKPETGEEVVLRWQSPRLKIPFGISLWDKDGPVSYSMPQNLTDPQYLAFLQELDRCLLDGAVSHQKDWFPEKPVKSADVLRELYTPLVRGSDNEKYPPAIRLKCHYLAKSNQMRTKFWNDKKEMIPHTDVAPQSEAVAVCECPHLWFILKGFGASVQVNQAKVYSTLDRFDEYGIQDGDEEMADECPQD